MENEPALPSATAHCHLWPNPPATRYAVLDSLETLETFLDEYHETRDLKRCKKCGQLYFSEWLEVMRFDGEDTQDEHLIPVATADEARALSKQSRWSRIGLPTLVMIWPPNDAKPYWVNR
jgi:hypothetical protein